MRTKIVIYSFIGFFYILFACSEKEQIVNYSGKNIDDSIIGVWKASYISRDANNGITVFCDTLAFESNNQGNHKIFEFKTLDFSQSFQFFTGNNFLHIKYDQIKDEVLWIYTIRNDSLIFKGNKIYTK